MNGGLPRCEIEAIEVEAQEPAQRALEQMFSDASAAAQLRRGLPASDAHGRQWEPSSNVTALGKLACHPRRDQSCRRDLPRL